jgi:aryl-alcohol dehydrogenase-like predicted oxidoreductase
LHVAKLAQRVLGDQAVSSVGLGCMPLSFGHMVDRREQAIATIHRALDLGITLLDTANIYAPRWDAVGHNEALVAEALESYSGPASLTDLLVTTKGGITRGPGETWGRDSAAMSLQAACEESLAQLGVEIIDLYQHHRHDPSQTYESQMKALAALKERNLVRQVGVSNVNSAELTLALDLLGGPSDGGIVSVQNEFSPRYRGEADVLDMCTERGIAFLPWSPLGGSEQAKDVGSYCAVFADVGAEIGASAQEVVLAWLLARSPVIIPIPGATHPETVESIVHAASLSLTPEQFTRLDSTVPEQSSMYPDDEPRSALR